MARISKDKWDRFQKAASRVGLAWLCCWAALSFGQDVSPAVAPPPKWVVPLTFDRRAASAEAGTGAVWGWLLVERQYNAQTDEQFCHQACQVPAAAAGSNPPPLAINYDPGCQLL